MAEAAGVKTEICKNWEEAHWTRIEAGKKMSLETLAKAANSFDLTVEELIAEAVLRYQALLLLELWREQHPNGHEQTKLTFEMREAVALPVSLFELKESS